MASSTWHVHVPHYRWWIHLLANKYINRRWQALFSRPLTSFSLPQLPSSLINNSKKIKFWHVVNITKVGSNEKIQPHVFPPLCPFQGFGHQAPPTNGNAINLSSHSWLLLHSTVPYPATLTCSAQQQSICFLSLSLEAQKHRQEDWNSFLFISFPLSPVSSWKWATWRFMMWIMILPPMKNFPEGKNTYGLFGFGLLKCPFFITNA